MDSHASWDSMAHINLILAIEQELRISFTPEEASLATSFGAILGMVAARR
jgi:acyl carrier protein